MARTRGHAAMAAWLGRVREQKGWARHVSEPRYVLAVIRALCAGDRARRKRADFGTEQLFDFLFPAGRPSRRAPRRQPRLPDDVFTVVARFYFGGGLWAEEEAAVVAEVAEREAAAEEEASDSE
mmetsp:Transcript_21488/g.64343  ORF Transcript_21488/g.64343 Transcript_21488/m.64343 type:complete len:124 (+) Transcript_21488:398-769(+)